MSIKRLIAIAPILIAIAADAFCANANDIIRRAEVAGRFVSYRGTKVTSIYFGGDYVESTLKIIHKMPNLTRMEFFTPTPMTGFLVVQNKDHIWTYNPAEGEWEEKPALAKIASDNANLELIRNYDLRIVGKDQIAGRNAYVVYAVPKSSADVSKRLWIDSNYYLVMRSQAEDRHGAVLNSSKYINIDFNPKDIPASAFVVHGRVRTCPKQASVRFQVLLPKYLPSGYRLNATSTITVNGVSCSHMQFFNGSNVISLFQREAKSRQGNVPASVKSKVTKVLTWSRNGMSFTLIGDVPSLELKKIADSIP